MDQAVLVYAKAIRGSENPPFAVIVGGIEGCGALTVMDAFTSVGVPALRVTPTNDIDTNAVLKLSTYLGKVMPLLHDLVKSRAFNVVGCGDESGVNQVSNMNIHRSEISLDGMKVNVISVLTKDEDNSVGGGGNWGVHGGGDSLLSGERKSSSTAGMEARIQTGSLPAVGCSVLFAFLGFSDDARIRGYCTLPNSRAMQRKIGLALSPKLGTCRR